MNIALSDIPNSVELRLGMPRPDWTVIYDWVEQHVPSEDKNAAWLQLAADWLDTLIAALPAGYRRTESNSFFLVAKSDDQLASRLLHMCEVFRGRILQALPGVAHDDGLGKHVVLAFKTVDTYYDYVCDFYPDDGEYGLSAGMYIHQGYGHLVLLMRCCRGTVHTGIQTRSKPSGPASPSVAPTMDRN